MSDDEVIDGDVALLRATRTGDSAAFGHLYERHAGAALVVARQYTDSSADAEDVVADAFANVHRALLGGHGPEAAFRAYLFTVVRRVAAVQRAAGRRAEPTGDVAALETVSTPVEPAEEPALAGLERSLVARAFRSLPERWQEVLWHSEVEGLTPAQIAPIVGLTANSAAALAYRAREGLRQAYLQQHLQDPAEDGCRAVAGRLGAHVRGGLGARDTRAVEEHLDECGGCRALVLELDDVSHGMRAVVAPLVLGLLGLGALAHELPVGGGLVAGSTALAAGAHAGQATGGAGAGGGAGGGGAAGGGAAGTTAALPAAGAVGGSVAAGAGGLLAGASAAAVAAVVAVAVVVAAVVIGVVQLAQGPASPAAAPSPGVSGASETAGASPTPRTASPTPRPSASGTPSSTEAQDDEAQDDDVQGTSEPAVEPGRLRAAGTRPAVVAPGDVVQPGQGAEPGPGGAPDPGPTVAPEPTAAPTPAPAPADVVVAVPQGGIALTAGVADQQVALAVSNVGGSPAGELVADVVLPSGVTVVAGPVVQAVRGFALFAADAWTCLADGDGSAARCTLGELAPGASADLVLGVDIDEAFQASGEEAVRVRITGAGHTWEPSPVRVAVAASPARLAFDADVPAGTQLVAGRSRTLDLPVRNAGGTGVQEDAAATVELQLPPGVRASGAAPWRCATGTDGTVRCRHTELAPFERSTLRLTLSAAPGATPGAGVIRARLTPSTHRDAEAREIGYVLVRPAVLSVDAPARLTLAPGAPADLPVTVANDGDLAAAGAVLTVTPPTGATVLEAAGPGWTCAADGPGVRCTGDVAPAAAGTVTARLDAPAGLVGDLGGATVAVRAPDADVTVRTRTVAVTAAPPVLAVSDLTALVDGTRTGTVAFAVTATGAAAADVVATVQLPPGVTLDADPTTPGPCTGGRVVTCALGELPAGGPQAVEVPVRADGALLGRVEARVTATGAAPVTAATQLVVASADLTPVWSGTGDLDVTEVGAPLLHCVDYAQRTCPAVRQDRDNNGLDMRPLDETPPPGARAAVPVSSQTRLDVPDGRPVVWAGLYWSGVRGPQDTWSGPLGTARLRAPDGSWADVTAGPVREVADGSGRRYYQAAVDVTDLVARGGGGTWALADAAVSATRTDRDPTYYAGWSLVVVHGTPSTDVGAATVTVHQGGSWIGSHTTAPAFVFVADPGSRVRIGVVAWEGDRGTTGDRLTLAGVGALTPQRWDGQAVVGGGSSANAFDSTATGWEHPNSLGVDAKSFAEVDLPSGVGALTPSTAGDQYLIGAVTVRTVPSPAG